MAQGFCERFQPRFGIIADDLTGAAELAGAAWALGLSAEVHTASTLQSQAQVIAIDTDSRLCSSQEAARRVQGASRQLQGLGVNRFYKKVDSVLRGNVVAELEAMLAALGLERALLVPANPTLGRTIRDGVYYLGDSPIAQTDFRNDPHHPRLSSQVLQLLGGPGAQPLFTAAWQEPPWQRGICVGEAASAQDLRRWAAHLDEQLLPAGALEFFVAILARAGATGPGLAASAPPRAGLTLYVCGSRSAASHEFVQHWRQRKLPLFTLPPALPQASGAPEELGQAWAKAILPCLGQHPQALVALDLPPVQTPPQRLTAILVAAVQALLGQAGVERLNVEGGATAAALLQALNWQRLQVVAQLAPGVVTLAAQSAAKPLLTLKPGSYRWPASLWP